MKSDQRRLAPTDPRSIIEAGNLLLLLNEKLIHSLIECALLDNSFCPS